MPVSTKEFFGSDIDRIWVCPNLENIAIAEILKSFTVGVNSSFMTL